MKSKIFLLALTFGILQNAFADYTVEGTFEYRDIFIGLFGFTGENAFRPVRFVDIVVTDDNTNQTLATTSTNSNGYFNVNVVDSQVRNLSILAVANTTSGQPYNIKVANYSSFGVGATHAYELNFLVNHQPTQNINLGTVQADYQSGGEIFNIFDVAVDGIDFLATLGESNPWPSFTAEYTFGTTNFAFASGGTINLGGVLGYDDTIILHEMGHWVQFNFGGFSDNPGGTHIIGDDGQDPRLSFGEGWPTFWGSNVRNYFNKQGLAGYDHPNVYMNSTGDSTSGVLDFAYDLETTQNAGGSQVGLGGASSEVSVQAALWDMTDDANTEDYSQGTDDETGFALNQPFQKHWDFITTYLSQPPFSGQLAFDDYYFLFNQNVTNPETQKFTDMLNSNHGFAYFADSLENDNSFANAFQMTFADVGEQKLTYTTIFPTNDDDWRSFPALAGITYKIRTLNLNNGLDTQLELYDSGNGFLSQNNNSGANVLASEITYTPNSDQTLYFKVTTPTTPEPYAKVGGYIFSVVPDNVPATYPNIQTNPGGVILQVANSTTGANPVKNLEIENTGSANTLNYTLEFLDFNTLQPSTFDWFSVNQLSGSLASGASETLVITFDANVAVQGINRAKLRIVSNDPNNPHQDLSVNLNNQLTVSIEEEISELPKKFELSQNFPNPFNPSTIINFQLLRNTQGKLTIFNVRGEKVKDFILSQNRGSVVWDGTNNFGEAVSSGIYFYKLEAGNDSQIKKMTFLK